MGVSCNTVGKYLKNPEPARRSVAPKQKRAPHLEADHSSCSSRSCPIYEDYLQFGENEFLRFMQNSTSLVMSSALK